MRPRIRDIGPQDRQWLVDTHATLYARDEGFDARFAALVAEIVDSYLATRKPPRERGWMVEGPEGRLGCIFCTEERPDLARLRMFLVLPEARGLGLGRRLLDLCTRHARDHRYGGMTLWTHESHAAACRLYRRAGWSLGASVPTRSFGVDVVEQTWHLDF